MVYRPSGSRGFRVSDPAKRSGPAGARFRDPRTALLSRQEQEDLTVRSGMAITLAGMIREQDRAEASWIASYLSDLLRRTAGLNIAFLPQEKGAAPSPGITLMLSPEQSSELSVQAKESYDLDVSPGGIVIRARTTAGLFYGAVTLWQLLTQTPDCRGPVTLNAVHIHDEPRFAWRGFMLDFRATLSERAVCRTDY